MTKGHNNISALEAAETIKSLMTRQNELATTLRDLKHLAKETQENIERINEEQEWVNNEIKNFLANLQRVPIPRDPS